MPLVRASGVNEITFRISLNCNGSGSSPDFDGLFNCSGSGSFSFTDTDDLRITNYRVISSGGNGGVSVNHNTSTGVWTFTCSSSVQTQWHSASSSAYGTVEITMEIG